MLRLKHSTNGKVAHSQAKNLIHLGEA